MNITTKNLTARDVLQIGVGLFETFTPTDAAQDENLGTRVVPREVARFLARLRLLVGVPFAYLVPDSDLLPPEPMVSDAANSFAAANAAKMPTAVQPSGSHSEPAIAI